MERLQQVLQALRESRAAGSAQEAWNRIDAALEQVQPEDKDGRRWVIPTLNAPSSKPYGADGTALRLIGHQIYINANGAFRIVELTDRIVPIFEKASSAGTPFMAVEGYRMPFV
ncbi:hypothetical protein LZK73_11985 [Neorhizobium galegae]|nr:hypothetical protein LZK73_11985 [Neorhizobium galegae]